jgi:hypothetical protein
VRTARTNFAPFSTNFKSLYFIKKLEEISIIAIYSITLLHCIFEFGFEFQNSIKVHLLYFLHLSLSFQWVTKKLPKCKMQKKSWVHNAGK